ncbi:MAG: hypothetical protein IKD04_03840 [Clostridia bacterium]|nr:hypothetical protein [Clostridia bacterium]
MCFSQVCVSADGYTYIPYDAYGYDEWNSLQSSTSGYIPEKAVYSDNQSKIFFSKPQDMVFADDGNIYVLNSGEVGVIILNTNFDLIGQISDFYKADGEKINLLEPIGIYVREQKLYIADKGLQEVLVCDLSGKIIKELTKPTNAVFPQQKEFLPTKVLSDSYGNIYVIVDGIYQGAVCFDADGNFTEFFGSNDVVLTASQALQRFWRNFMTEAQRDSTSGIVPTEYTNFDIDSEDFIYSCTAVGSGDTNQLRKLNPLGDNIYVQRGYGDLEKNWVKGKYKQTSFIDVAIDNDGFLFALDETYGRIFVYDSEGNETFVFGAIGERLGNFENVTAIDVYDNCVYVLDGKKASITKFIRTDYGQTVCDATLAYLNGNYEDSKQLWENVLQYNCNNKLAYNGIGKAYYYSGDYENAKKFFVLGADKAQESKVFDMSRKVFLRNLLVYAVPAVIIGAVLLIAFNKIRKRGKTRCGKR